MKHWRRALICSSQSNNLIYLDFVVLSAATTWWPAGSSRPFCGPQVGPDIWAELRSPHVGIWPWWPPQSSLVVGFYSISVGVTESYVPCQSRAAPCCWEQRDTRSFHCSFKNGSEDGSKRVEIHTEGSVGATQVRTQLCKSLWAGVSCNVFKFFFSFSGAISEFLFVFWLLLRLIATTIYKIIQVE